MRLNKVLSTVKSKVGNATGKAPETTLFDMHCHAGFAPDATAVARAARRAGIGLLSATVTPAEYREQRETLAQFGNVRVGLGLHPWWLADGRCGEADVEEFCELASDERIIAEIGLDFGGGRGASRDVQRAAFERMARACAGEHARKLAHVAPGQVPPPPRPPANAPLPPHAPVDAQPAETTTAPAAASGAATHSSPSAPAAATIGAPAPHAAAPTVAAAHATAAAPRKLLSLHAFDAATDVLDILERTGCLDACDCVFHWFSGSQQEVLRAVDAGCYFSVNRRMLSSKRGWTYVQAIPTDRLLLETDMPSKAVDAFDFTEQETWLRSALQHLSKLDRDPQLDETIAATSRRLLFGEA